MLVNKGITVHAISFDANPPAVLVESADGYVQVCPIKKWFRHGDPPQEVPSHLTADLAAIEVLGFDHRGVPSFSRYDVRLEGIGPPIPRNADGSFGAKAGRRLDADLKARAARLPAVFDTEGY